MTILPSRHWLSHLSALSALSGLSRRLAGRSRVLAARFDGRPHALQDGQVQRLPLRRGDRVCALEGRLWLTAAGEPQDHILNPGDTWVAGVAGGVLVQAVCGPARFSCRCAARPFRPDGRHLV